MTAIRYVNNWLNDLHHQCMGSKDQCKVAKKTVKSLPNKERKILLKALKIANGDTRARAPTEAQVKHLKSSIETLSPKNRTICESLSAVFHGRVTSRRVLKEIYKHKSKTVAATDMKDECLLPAIPLELQKTVLLYFPADSLKDIVASAKTIRSTFPNNPILLTEWLDKNIFDILDEFSADKWSIAHSVQKLDSLLSDLPELFKKWVDLNIEKIVEYFSLRIIYHPSESPTYAINEELRLYPGWTGDILRTHWLEYHSSIPTNMMGLSSKEFKKNLPSLRTVHLSSLAKLNGWTCNHSLKSVFSQLENVTFLKLRSNGNTTIPFSSLPHPKKLLKLYILPDTNKKNLLGLKQINVLQNLTSLFLVISNHELNLKPVYKIISELEKLEMLALKLCKVIPGDLSFLTAFQNLKKLEFFSVLGITDQELDHVVKCKKLTHLYFHKAAITDEGLKKLKQLPLLTKLTLNNCDYITRKGHKYLRTLKNLDIRFI